MTQAFLVVARNGRVVIPADMRAQLGFKDGGKVIARIVDGAVVLEPIAVSIRRAQEMVQAHFPENVSLADELIAERRAEAARE